jgi:hypothetical protein
MASAEQFADRPEVSLSPSQIRKIGRSLHRHPNNTRAAESLFSAVCCLFGDNTGATLWNVLDARGSGPQFSGTDTELTAVVRDIVGNPFRPVVFDPRWRSETAVALASGIYAERAFDRMPILADALEEAGCDHADVLHHCRDPHQPHARGCGVADLVLGKS